MSSLAKSFLFFLIIVTGAFLWVWRPGQSTAVPANPITAHASNQPQAQTVDNLDGTLHLIMQGVKNSDGTTTYSFTVRDSQSGKTTPILTKTTADTMAIPGNAWSPNNAYVFLAYREGENETFFVVKADGQPFASGDQYLDIRALWTARAMDLTLGSATGWAGNDLIVLATRKPDGTDGPHYWFVVSSRGFMLLSR